MARFDTLHEHVKALYSQKFESRDPWADWLYPNHVVLVTENARKIAERHGANTELSQVAALLHDVADIKMERSNSEHEAESLRIARDVMKECGYTEQEIALVVDDAIRHHSCYGNERPKSREGLVLATADSVAHLETGLYIHAVWQFGKQGKNLEDVRSWALTKLERDLHSKISFDDIREEMRPNYEILKQVFTAL